MFPEVLSFLPFPMIKWKPGTAEKQGQWQSMCTGQSSVRAAPNRTGLQLYVSSKHAPSLSLMTCQKRQEPSSQGWGHPGRCQSTSTATVFILQFRFQPLTVSGASKWAARVRRTLSWSGHPQLPRALVHLIFRPNHQSLQLSCREQTWTF